MMWTIAQITEAKSLSDLFGTGNLYNDLLLLAIFVVLLVIFGAIWMTLKALRAMVRVSMPQVYQQELAQKTQAKAARQASRKAFWNKITGLKPIEAEKDILIDHEYDGIRELDNPIPVWFNGMFYASVAFAVVYLAVYHVFGWGLNQDQEYQREMARAEKARQEFLAKSANNVDETTVTVDLSVETVKAGQALFTQHCVVCHGGAGEGGIGPNLADDYWLHGHRIGDIFSVIKYGVLDKGMVPWEQNLTPAQIAQLSNYILSLRGTNPPNPKAPQGEKVDYDEAATEGGVNGAEAEAESSAESASADDAPIKI